MLELRQRIYGAMDRGTLAICVRLEKGNVREAANALYYEMTCNDVMGLIWASRFYPVVSLSNSGMVRHQSLIVPRRETDTSNNSAS